MSHEELIADCREILRTETIIAPSAFRCVVNALAASEQARREAERERDGQHQKKLEERALRMIYERDLSAAESAAAEMRTRHEKRRERLRVEIDAVVPPYPTMGMGGGSVAEEAAQKEWEAKYAHLVPLLNAIDESNVLEPLAEDTAEGMYAKIIEGLRDLASDRAARLCAQGETKTSAAKAVCAAAVRFVGDPHSAVRLRELESAVETMERENQESSNVE